MIKNPGTSNCIKCGKPATIYGGHVIGRQKMALGNLIEVKILAGWCKDHRDSMVSDKNGCFGQYDNKKHGNVISIKF
jgi:hypothetical protein